jgi:SAM-dependent methyltransferase
MNHSLVATSSSPPRSVNTAFSGHSDSGKRQARLKESQFIYKYGQKLHSFEPEKVPYPMSYSKDVLELEHLDVRFVKYLREGSVSFFDFPEEERPERCLDIGCGTGSWVIEAAKEWPKCDFIGLDLVNMQIPLNILDSSVRERIQWIHGNFLTSRLHFEDDSFDHIHISSIATSVPENKWGVLFDVCRYAIHSICTQILCRNYRVFYDPEGL